MPGSKPVGSPAQQGTEKISALQKDQTLTVYQAHPLNVGAPQTCVRQTFLTPNECFFVRNHSGVMPVGLDHMEMQLLTTKYYTFHPGQMKPSIQELDYAWSSQVERETSTIAKARAGRACLPHNRWLEERED